MAENTSPRFSERCSSTALLVGLGAGLMYLLDPESGRRRRALARDQFVHGISNIEEGIGVLTRDISNRTQGLFSEISHSPLLGGSDTDVTDQILVARVRAKLGRCVSHPRAIQVDAQNGTITLSGPVLRSEADQLLCGVNKVRGVKNVENRLEVHDQPGNIPALQGGRGRTGERSELTQMNWSPTTRFFTGAAGSVLLLRSGRGLLGLPLRLIGASLLTRSLTNLPAERLFGTGGGRRAVDLHKTINIEAPLEDVFDFWANYENFPRFMTNVRSVSDLGDGRSHWVVKGPAGADISWNSVLTAYEPPEVIAWKTEPGASVQHSGIVRFDSLADGRTSVDVQMSYNPPGGAMGHTVAWLIGEDPKQKLDEDLMRMKSFLESGIPARDAARGKESPLSM